MKIESHVSGSRCDRRLDASAASGSRLEHSSRELPMPRQPLDAVAIVIARDEIHAGIHARGIGAQRLFDDAHRLDEFRQSIAPRKRDCMAVADGHLIGRLGLVVRPLQLLAGQALFGEPVLDPTRTVARAGFSPATVRRVPPRTGC